jgi:CheY-like chemotaxis protein
MPDAVTPVERPLLLLVEDDGLVRATLVDVLNDGGFEVLEAEGAQEALDLVCHRHDIAALVTDINLPGGADGFTLARAVRLLRPRLPVLYASGRFMAPERGRTVEGARFLAKPFPPALACGILHEMLREERLGPAVPPPPRTPPGTDRHA